MDVVNIYRLGHSFSNKHNNVDNRKKIILFFFLCKIFDLIKFFPMWTMFSDTWQWSKKNIIFFSVNFFVNELNSIIIVIENYDVITTTTKSFVVVLKRFDLSFFFKKKTFQNKCKNNTKDKMNKLFLSII